MDIKRYRNITLSIVAHAIFLYWLSTSVAVLPQESTKQDVTAIKSYLYRPVAKKIVVAKGEVKTAATQTLKPTAKTDSQPVNITENNVTITLQTRATLQKKLAKIKNNESAITKPAISSATKHANTPKPTMTLSPQAMIGNLRQAINKNIIEQEVKLRQQFRSVSVMHKAPPRTPKSLIKLSPEEEKQQNTTQMSSSISITKLKNGLCQIEREKQYAIDIDSSTSWFACGESDFDKNFRLHMKKVREKILPIN